MGARSIFMPDVGEGVAEAEIVEWSVKLGDLVREDQVVCAVMTDKATVEIPTPVAGAVTYLGGEVGDKLAVGSELIRIEAPDAAPRPHASPAVRKHAREAGVDLNQVRGSGPKGHITHDDISAPRPPVPDTGVETIKVTGLRRRIAENMAEATRRVAHFSYVEEVDVTALEELRATLGGEERVTLLPFLMIGLVRSLKAFPQINAHYDDEAGEIHRYAAVHLGIATQTPSGLSVPVVRHAETLGLREAAREMKRVTEAARAGTATREEMTGSTITLTSLGALGGIVSTPIVNRPEVAIVGVNKIVVRPVWRDGAFVPRKMMNLSSSFDHRIVDGFDAASFIQRLRQLLEQPALLFV